MLSSTYVIQQPGRKNYVGKYPSFIEPKNAARIAPNNKGYCVEPKILFAPLSILSLSLSLSPGRKGGILEISVGLHTRLGGGGGGGIDAVAPPHSSWLMEEENASDSHHTEKIRGGLFDRKINLPHNIL